MALVGERDAVALRRARIILVEAEPAQAKQALTALSGAGYECIAFTEADSAIAQIEQTGADVVVAEFSSARNASELLRRVRLHSPATAVILTVSNPAAAAAVDAIRQGAFDYLVKPLNPDELTAVVGKALEMAALKRENRVLREQLERREHGGRVYRRERSEPQCRRDDSPRRAGRFSGADRGRKRRREGTRRPHAASLEHPRRRAVCKAELQIVGRLRT